MTVKTDPTRDRLFDELGLMRLRESYMRPDEKSPQERFRFVAETFGSNPEHAQRIYDYASRHWLSFSTPVLAFGRAKKGLPVSCYLTYMDDSAEGLVNTLSEVNWLSMLGGGVGKIPAGARLHIRWLNSNKSREDLGYGATVLYYEKLLRRCHPNNRPRMEALLAEARRGEGETLFEKLTALIARTDTGHDCTLSLE